MDAFGYLSVLLSIVLGLALTQLLTGAGRLLKASERVKPYAPALIWMAILFMVIVQSWWTLFSLRKYDEWTILAFVVVLLHPVLLYVMVELMTPEIERGEEIDLKSAYFRQAPMFFVAIMLLIAVSLLRPVVLLGRVSNAADVLMQSAFFLAAAGGAVWKNSRFHIGLAAFAVLWEAVYVGWLFLELN